MPAGEGAGTRLTLPCTSSTDAASSTIWARILSTASHMPMLSRLRYDFVGLRTSIWPSGSEQLSCKQSRAVSFTCR